MDDFVINFKSSLWVWDGPNPWYFITVPEKESKIIRERFRHVHRGWGSVPVTVQIGDSTWKTSIFWEKAGTYMLPIKKEIRINEDIKVEQKIKVALEFEELL